MIVIIYLVLKGENLMSNVLYNITTLNFTKTMEKGDLILEGRFKGEKSKTGIFELCNEVNAEDVNIALDGILVDLSDNLELLKDAGLEQIEINLAFEFLNQFNWEFENKHLKIISEINAKFSITAYQA